MTQYRLYYMAEDTTRIRGFEAIEAEDDTSALLGVQERQRTMAMELWCANRMVRRWSLVPSSEEPGAMLASQSQQGGLLAPQLRRSA